MNDVLKFSRKAFTWFVVGATILWAMSAAFVVVPAKAATLSPGDLIRGTEKSIYGGYPVYYYGADGKKYLFPNEATYKTWYSDFSNVKVITQEELGAIPFGGNVTVKPGSKLVKFPGDNKVYAVDKGGVLRHVTSEAIAQSLYGADWYKIGVNLLVIPEGFQANYQTGTAINQASEFDKAAVLNSVPDINTDKNLGGQPVAGALSVALASNNPAGATLPRGASGVTMLTFKLAAGASPVTINSITLKRSGVGAVSDFDYVYLYEGSNRLTTGRTIRSTDNLVEFTNLNLTIGANSEKVLSAVVDVSGSATASDNHALSVTSIGTSATVSGLPVIGNSFTIGNQSVAILTVQKGTAPSNPTVGQKGVAISEFKLVNNGSADMKIYRIGLVQAGNIPNTDLANLELYQGSTKLASVASLSGDKIRFVLDAPYVLPQGATRIFTVKADVSGYAGRTIRTYVEYASDIYAVDTKYDFGAKVDFSAFDGSGTPPNERYIEVQTQGGKLTIAFNGPTASDLSINSQDAVLYKFAITAGAQAVEVRNLRINLAGEDADAYIKGTSTYFTDIALKNEDTGARIDSKELNISGTSSSADITFNSPFTIEAGKTVNLSITADLANSEDPNFKDRKYRITLKPFQSGDVKEVATNQNVTDIVPNADIAGNFMKILASSLTVTKASTPVSGTTVKGSTGVETVGFAFAAGSSSDIKVTQITLSGVASTATSTAGEGSKLREIVLSARLYDGSTPISEIASPDSSGNILFDNLNWTIPAGATKKLTVKVDLASTLINNATTYFRIGMAANAVVAQDKDGNTLSNVPGGSGLNNTGNIADNTYTTVQSAGTLSASLDGDTPVSTILVAGTSDNPVLKIKFTSSLESFLVKKLSLVFSSATFTQAVEAVKISYPTQSGATEETEATVSDTNVNFNGLNFYVKQDVSNILTAKLKIRNYQEGGISGTTSTLALLVSSDFEAVGQGSGTTVTSLSGSDIAGNYMKVHKTKPTVTLASYTPSTLPGWGEVLRFTVSADNAGDLELTKITIKVLSSDRANSNWNYYDTTFGTSSGWKLYKSDDLNTELTANKTFYQSDGSSATSTAEVGYVSFEFTNPITISKGTSKTFVLYVDTSKANSGTDGDTVRFDVVNDIGSSNHNGFVWNETGSGRATDINGTLVKNLPVTGQTISYR